jgi:type 1 fimbriae regulatory protein FimB/type 1 fimbriae regulatory protein FimE
MACREIAYEVARAIEQIATGSRCGLHDPPYPSSHDRRHRTASEVRDEEKRTAPPKRVPNKTVRSREYLTSEEVEKLIRAASRVGRHGHRDAALILIAYRHGLRVGELVSLRWDQVDFTEAVLRVTRSKNGTASNHPIGTVETRALRRLRRDYTQSPYVFMTERKGPMTDANVRKVLARAGRLARLPFTVHPHMLRHACGYKLANDGHDTRAIQHYLGHKNIVHTVRYTELASDRFKGFWSD